ncbi:DUF4233 domain-containing protein [Actinokineospora bangkokensis]|uniref:DUF4233 domain-containing protein n=1 Tax=Actinokineospora bangkokensis TaxID=1193682 RepID=A0A1Q9LTH9_9PSEU|nr:DUF4233 domain-containing protein [Actinokineospora bangkokensis]OLR95338.1 hypothetical protein BJP25_06150 [Actinokineospora bangkokensis]
MTDDPTTPATPGGDGVEQPAPPPDPMKGFRGVCSAMFILEAIVVLLALLVVAKDDDITTTQGWLVGLIALALVLSCALVARRWLHWVVIALHALLIACGWFLPALAVVGILFALVWAWMFWARNDVRKRMEEGRLTSQQ